jgi:hypothetical protein
MSTAAAILDAAFIAGREQGRESSAAGPAALAC